MAAAMAWPQLCITAATDKQDAPNLTQFVQESAATWQTEEVSRRAIFPLFKLKLGDSRSSVHFNPLKVSSDHLFYDHLEQ